MEQYIHTLDKANFFYSSVVTLAYTQFGVNEIFARGFLTQLHNAHPNKNDFAKCIKTYRFPSAVEKEIFNSDKFTPLIFVPGFTTKDKTMTYQMEPNASAIEFIKDTMGITNANIDLTK